MANPPLQSGSQTAQASPASSASTAYNYKAVMQEMVKQGASDLHLKVGRPPTLRINGELVPLPFPPLRLQ